MLLPRILSALVLAPLVLALLWYGEPRHLILLLAPVSLGLLAEWLPMRGPARSGDRLLGGAGVALLFALAWFERWHGLPLVLALHMLLIFVVALTRYRAEAPQMNWVTAHVAGMVYCVLPMLLVQWVRTAPQGAAWLLYLLGVVWATDIGAYGFGRWLGVRKLAPAISPGKTWAGTVGGTLTAMAVGAGIAWGFALPVSLWHILLMSFVLSVGGQAGDLAESMLKREAGVKDSGTIIPGHGGLLDRLDSLLFAAPLLALFLYGMNLLGG